MLLCRLAAPRSGAPAREAASRAPAPDLCIDVVRSAPDAVHPEADVDLRGGIEVTRLDRGVLGLAIRAHGLRPLVVGKTGPAQHQRRGQLGPSDRQLQRDPAAHRDGHQRRPLRSPGSRAGRPGRRHVRMVPAESASGRIRACRSAARGALRRPPATGRPTCGVADAGMDQQRAAHPRPRSDGRDSMPPPYPLPRQPLPGGAASTRYACPSMARNPSACTASPCGSRSRQRPRHVRTRRRGHRATPRATSARSTWSASQGHTVSDITVSASDAEHGQRIVDSVRTVTGVTLVNVSDRTFLMHLGGKIEVPNKVPVKTRDDLSMAYTPGVARVCMAIAQRRREGALADDQAEHGGRGHRRHRRARAGRHRPARRRCR